VEAKVFARWRKTQQKIAGLSMTVYPALVEEGGTVKEGRFSTPAEAEFQHRRALQRLLMQQLAEPAKFLRGKLPGLTELGLLYRELGRVEALVEDILLASLDSCILEGEATLPRDGAGWRIGRAQARQLDRARRAPGAPDPGDPQAVARPAKALQGQDRPGQAVALNDIKQQLSHLVYPVCPGNADAMAQGTAALPEGGRAAPRETAAQVQKDRVWSGELAGLWAQYQAARQACPGRQARSATGVVSLVAGGISGVAVRPAVGNQGADFRALSKQWSRSRRDGQGLWLWL
jgi:ATP-dependent helicase HrpA